MTEAGRRPDSSDEEILEYYSDPSGGGCVGCPLGEPFISAAEIDIMMRGLNFVQSGSEFKRGGRAIADATDIGIIPKDRTSLFAAGLAGGPPRRLLYTIRAAPRARRTANSLVVDKFLIPHKIVLMHHFACGLRNIHRAGYAHTNISLTNLLIGGGDPPGPGSKLVGFVGGLGAASALSRSGAALSCVARGVTSYRAPETFIEYDILNNTYFEYDGKADVWALAIAYISIVTGGNVFTIGDIPGLHTSAKGRERVDALRDELKANGKNSVVQQKDIDRAIAIECVRWQTFKNFGQLYIDATPENLIKKPELADLIARDETQRRVNLALKISSAPNLTDEWKQTFVDLLSRMLHPCPDLRASADEVAAHPAFRNTSGWSERVFDVKKPSEWWWIGAVDPIVTIMPRGGWTANKDEMLVRTLLNLISSEGAKHVAAEALFVAHDLVTRTMAGVDAPEPSDLLATTSASAARIALLLFDVSTSLDIDTGMEGETSDTRAYGPYTVEYLGGRLRRNNLYTHVVTKADAVRAVTLVTGTTPLAKEFRANYLKLIDGGPNSLRPRYLPALSSNPSVEAARDAHYVTRLKLLDVRQLLIHDELVRF